MTSIGPIVPEPPIGRPRRQAEPKAAARPEAQGRALIPVTSVESATDEGYRRLPRASAPYLAQLIANERQLPQTRERRRAEPMDAVAAYVAAARLTRAR